MARFTVCLKAHWSHDDLGSAVFGLLARWLDDTVMLALDDTLVRKRGRKVFGAGMHHATRGFPRANRRGQLPSFLGGAGGARAPAVWHTPHLPCRSCCGCISITSLRPDIGESAAAALNWRSRCLINAANAKSTTSVTCVMHIGACYFSFSPFRGAKRRL